MFSQVVPSHAGWHRMLLSSPLPLPPPLHPPSPGLIDFILLQECTQICQRNVISQTLDLLFLARAFCFITLPGCRRESSCLCQQHAQALAVPSNVCPSVGLGVESLSAFSPGHYILLARATGPITDWATADRATQTLVPQLCYVGRLR